LKDCLEYPNDFESGIYKYFDLPKIENNIVEGVVIKPNATVFFGNGERVILKNKNEKWTEKAKQPKVKVKSDVKLTEDAKRSIEVISQYVTENRLKNIISKIGTVTTKDFGKVLSAYIEDIFDDVIKDGNRPDFDDSTQKIIRKTISKVASDILRPNFRNIIDGTF